MTETEKKLEKGEYIIGIAVILAALLLCVTIYAEAGSMQSVIQNIKITAAAPTGTATTAGTTGTAATPTTLSQSAIENFLDSNFLSAQGLTAKVTSVAPYSSTLSTVTVNIMNGSAVLQSGVTFYATNDGSTILVGGEAYMTNQTVPKPTTPATTPTTQPAQQAAAPTKSATPNAEVFVMAHCPYGVQFLKAYAPVMELLGNYANISVGFVDYSMHGPTEIVDNNVMHCVQANKSYNFTAYLRCYVVDENSSRCLAATGISPAAISACTSALDQEYSITALEDNQSDWLNGQFPPYNVDEVQNQEYGVQGSPTFVLDGVQANPDRTAESIKEAICAAFTNPPAACNTSLSTVAEQPGPGPIGGGTGTASTTAGCGT